MIIKYQLFPTKGSRFEESGWAVGDENSSMQIDLRGKSICIEFSKKPQIRIWSRKKNGDLNKLLQEFEV